MECQDLCVNNVYKPGIRVVFPMTVCCRIAAKRAAQIAESEVFVELQEALDDMVEELVSESDLPSHISTLVKCTSIAKLTSIVRLNKPDAEYTSTT